MSELRIVKCDYCSTKEHHDDPDGETEDGWIITYDSTGRYDFCTRSCLINHYTGEDFKDE